MAHAALLLAAASGLVGAAMAGCIAATEPPPDPPVAATVTSLAFPSCVARGAAFDITLGLTNDEARAGSTLVMVDAEQWGHLVNERVHLAARETRSVHTSGQIDLAGPWHVFVMSPGSTVEGSSLRVADASC